jgi:hypothetical protein
MLGLGIGATVRIRLELPEGFDPHLLGTFKFSSEIAVGLGMPRPMPARGAEHALGKQILGVGVPT